MKTFVILLLLLAVYSQAEDATHNIPVARRPEKILSPKCLLVTGKKDDIQKVFKQSSFLEEKKSVCHPCKEFKSWEDLSKWVENAPASELAENQPLLLLQAAHGVPPDEKNHRTFLQQEYACDSGMVGAENVFKHLQKLSQRRKVGSFIESCFSGAILSHKIMEDSANPKNSSIDNLCMMTGSQFNRTSFNIPSLTIDRLNCAKKEQSFENLFDPGYGMISSAAYEAIGASKSFTDDSLPDYKKILEIAHMCPASASDYRPISKIAVNPNITLEQYDTMQKLNYFFAELKVKTYTDFIKKNAAPYTSSIEDRENRKCVNTYLGMFERFGENSISLLTLSRIAYNFTTQYTNCSIPGDYGDTKENANKYAELKDKIVPELNAWVQEDLNLEQAGHLTLLAWLEKGLDKIPVKKSSNEELSPLQKALAKSLLGLPVLKSEKVMKMVNHNLTTPLYNDFLSAQALMKAFQCGSQLENALTHPLDKRRRKACQNFKF